MNEIKVSTAAAVVPANDLQPALFDSFISYIDRGAKTTKTYITNLRQFAAWMQYRAITRPIRQDIISYRDYLGSEHDAIRLDPVKGWEYRTDSKGNRYKVICKPSTEIMAIVKLIFIHKTIFLFNPVYVRISGYAYRNILRNLT